MKGEVIYVSADAVPGDRGGSDEEFYVARISLSADELARLNSTPSPGMPVEVLIQTAERTFFSYLVKPVVDSMSRAFTEQ